MMRSPSAGLAPSIAAALALSFGLASPLVAGVRDTSSEEATCKDIGFRPKTTSFADCVMELLSRKDGGGGKAVASPPVRQARTAKSKTTPSAPQPSVQVALTPDERTCTGYGFRKGTSDFGQCLMQLYQAQQQAQFAQQQYQLQLQQYQQQQAAYEAQQQAIKKERDRQKWGALARFGFGMAASNSPTLGGGITDGMRALNGQPPLPPPVAPAPPVLQNYTVRLPNGAQVYCNYNSAASYMSCR